MVFSMIQVDYVDHRSYWWLQYACKNEIPPSKTRVFMIYLAISGPVIDVSLEPSDCEMAMGIVLFIFL